MQLGYFTTCKRSHLLHICINILDNPAHPSFTEAGMDTAPKSTTRNTGSGQEKPNQESLLPSVMSQGTPPRKTLQEYRGSLLFLGGSWPLQVKVASLTAEEFRDSGLHPQGLRTGRYAMVVFWRISHTCSLSVQPSLSLDAESIVWLLEHVGTGPRRARTPAAGKGRRGRAGTRRWSQRRAGVLWI